MIFSVLLDKFCDNVLQREVNVFVTLHNLPFVVMSLLDVT